MTTLRRFAPANLDGGPSPAMVPPPPRETKPPKPPRNLRTPPQCQMDELRTGLRTGGSRPSSGSAEPSGRAPHFPRAPSADELLGGAASGYPPEKGLAASGSDARLTGVDTPSVEDLDGSSRASSRGGGQGTPANSFGGARGSTASIASSTLMGGLASSTASTRDPSPRPGSGASMTGASSGGAAAIASAAGRPQGYDGTLGAPVTWRSRPQDADRVLRNSGQGGGHLKCRRSNLAKIREIQGLPPRAMKAGPGSLLSSPAVSAR